MGLITVCPRNLLKLPALVKMGQIVLLFVTICIAQAGDSYPGFGTAVNLWNSTSTPAPVLAHYVESKNLYFFGAGITTCYLINCCVLLLCYLLDDTSTQTSKYEIGISALGSIFFLSLAMKIFVGSSSNGDDTAKLVTEGCCCLGVAILQIFDAIFIHLRIKNEE